MLGETNIGKGECGSAFRNLSTTATRSAMRRSASLVFIDDPQWQLLQVCQLWRHERLLVRAERGTDRLVCGAALNESRAR